MLVKILKDLNASQDGKNIQQYYKDSVVEFKDDLALSLIKGKLAIEQKAFNPVIENKVLNPVEENKTEIKKEYKEEKKLKNFNNKKIKEDDK